MVYWITGRSNAGKTTLANWLQISFAQSGKNAVVLDGDVIRSIFPSSFTDEGRECHILRTAMLAALLEKQGVIVIVALLSPKRKWRMKARQLFEESHLLYLPGGFLWKDTIYEVPGKGEALYMKKENRIQEN